MALSKQKKQEILDDIKKNGFKVWPKPAAEDIPYGPFPMQYEAYTIPHKHELDVCLVYGGARSGKSLSSVAAGIKYALSTPGIDILVGCEEYKHLIRMTQSDWRKMFSIGSDWDHPLITKRVTSHNNTLRFSNGSSVIFMHLKDWQILRGIKLGFAHLDEASLIQDVATFREIARRMSSELVTQKQILITTNPEESHGWIYEEFELERWEAGGELPEHCAENIDYPNKEYWEAEGYDLSKSYSRYVGKPCNCHLCQKCLNRDAGEVEYVNGVCPNCSSKKRTECPGNQKFMRVIMTDPKDNPHLSEAYRQTQKLLASEREFDLYTKGGVLELRTGKVYDKFCRKNNLYPNNVPIDIDKPIHWSFDFNISYQCSTICQEKENGDPHLLDEIVIPEAGPAEVAIEFLKRYWYFTQPIYIYHDPAAFNRSITADDGNIRVEMIKERLLNPEKFRFSASGRELFPACAPKNIILITKKEEKKTKVLQTARVDSLNELLNNGAGKIRLMINPKCEWSIKSLENIKWKEQGGTAHIDVLHDKLAAKAADKTKIRPLTHPTDALGYYIYKRYAIVKPKYAEMYAYVPGNPLIKTNSSGTGLEEIEEKPLKKTCVHCNTEFTDKDIKKCPYDGYTLLHEDDPRVIHSLEDDPSKITFKDVINRFGSFESVEENPFTNFWF